MAGEMSDEGKKQKQIIMRLSGEKFVSEYRESIREYAGAAAVAGINRRFQIADDIFQKAKDNVNLVKEKAYDVVLNVIILSDIH